VISAYRIGDHIYLVATDQVADPGPPDLLPMGSPQLTLSEAMDFALQILEAVASAMGVKAAAR